jgi:hypothetical protein
MYPTWKKRLSAPIIVVAAIAVLSLLIWSANRCNLPAIQEAAAAGCVEFWINRYQTLLSGLLAIMAAAIAATPVFRQLRESRRQSAAAAITPLRATARDIEDERLQFSQIDRSMQQGLVIIQTYVRPERDWSDRLDNFLNEIGQQLSLLKQYKLRHPDTGNSIDLIRTNAIQRYERLLIVCTNLGIAHRQQTNGVFHEDGEQELDSDLLAGIGGEARQAWDDAAQTLNQLRFGLTTEASVIWGRIRELERASVD